MCLRTFTYQVAKPDDKADTTHPAPLPAGSGVEGFVIEGERRTINEDSSLIAMLATIFT